MMRGGRFVLVAAIAIAVFPTTSAHASVSELCRFDIEKLPEISGLATSALHDRIVWAHNDSGAGPRVYALDMDTCEIRATLKIRGVDALDPEALALGTGSAGAPVLWWGDIGDNTASRRYVEIYEITEPSTLADATVTPTIHRVRLPEASDAEALVADGDRLWVIGKGLISGTVWRLPTPLPIDGLARARAVGTEDGLVTDAAMRPGGGYAVRDYSEVRIYSGRPPGTLVERMPLPEQIQGEALTWTSDGTALLVASEGDDRLLLVPVTSAPQAPSSATETEPTPATASEDDASAPAPSTPEAAAGASPIANALEPADRVGSLAVVALAVGAAVFAVSVLAVALLARLRSRRSPTGVD
ncbi:MAG: hypothetical protein ACO3TS_05330 [Candidatus Nanopelagicales bacterium]